MLPYKVAAQSGHNVTIIDVNNDLLSKSVKNIENSLSRVAKKKYADNEQVRNLFSLLINYIFSVVYYIVCQICKFSLHNNVMS